MMQTKICPDCGAEYFAHIENCADCGTALLLPEERAKAQEEKKRCMDTTSENSVIVREGSLNWMDELSEVLINSGIPCVVKANDGCGKGCCGDTHHLMVSSEYAEKAIERIAVYYMELHPELKDSNEMINQGKCPACGYAAGADAVECPDCGLTLLIIE